MSDGMRTKHGGPSLSTRRTLLLAAVSSLALAAGALAVLGRA